MSWLCLPLNPHSSAPSFDIFTKFGVCFRYPPQSHRLRLKNPPYFPNVAPQSVTAYCVLESEWMIPVLLFPSPSRASFVSQLEVSITRIFSPPSSREPTNGLSFQDQVSFPSSSADPLPTCNLNRPPPNEPSLETNRLARFKPSTPSIDPLSM